MKSDSKGENPSGLVEQHLEEYKTLREERLYYVKIRDQITIIMITSSLIIIGFNIIQEELSVLSLYIPIIVSFSSYIFYTYRTKYISKIESYLRAVLEKKLDGMNWHQAKYDYDFGWSYRIPWIAIKIALIGPIYLSFTLILLSTTEPLLLIVHGSLFIVFSIIILIDEISMFRGKKDWDQKWK